MQIFRIFLFLFLLLLNLNAKITVIDGVAVEERIGRLEKINDNYIVIVNNQQYLVHIKSKYVTEEAIKATLGRSDVTLYGKFHNNIFDAIVIKAPPLLIGFLAPLSCIENSEFLDCNLQKYASGEELILFSNGKKHFLDLSRVKKSELDQAVLKNNVYIYGEMLNGKILVEHLVMFDYQISFFMPFM